MHQWAESDEGKEYVEKASTSVTDAQKHRRLKSYFKTHAFYAYGGMLWLKFLVATGNVDVEAVDAVNHLCKLRTMDRRGAVPGVRLDATPGHIFFGAKPVL